MKIIDAYKFNEALLELEKSIRPSEADMSKQFVVTYWSAISVTLSAVRKAVELSSIDID